MSIELANKIMGLPGRLLSGSKSGYNRTHPENIVVFNANLCTKKLGKLWYGDVDITLDEAKLKELAVVLGEDLYILREHDARFSNENAPLFNRARAIVSRGTIKFQDYL